MSEKAERAVLAGGCFWTMQQLLRGRHGVISTRVGWMGGENENPTQENNVGHAEVVEVTFDPVPGAARVFLHGPPRRYRRGRPRNRLPL